MKKSCNGCRAHGKNYCILGYKTKITHVIVPAFGNRSFEKMVPLEECPKPLTYNNYMFELKLKKEISI